MKAAVEFCFSDVTFTFQGHVHKTRGSKGSPLDFSVIFKQLSFVAKRVCLLFINVKNWTFLQSNQKNCRNLKLIVNHRKRFHWFNFQYFTINIQVDVSNFIYISRIFKKLGVLQCKSEPVQKSADSKIRL